MPSVSQKSHKAKKMLPDPAFEAALEAALSAAGLMLDPFEQPTQVPAGKVELPCPLPDFFPHIPFHHRHAARRARQRYQLNLLPDDFAVILELIDAGGFEYLGPGHKGRSMYRGAYGDLLVRVIYDPKGPVLVTFLPLMDGPQLMNQY